MAAAVVPQIRRAISMHRMLEFAPRFLFGKTQGFQTRYSLEPCSGSDSAR
jgi:hypothetical protein